jgi:hypothetical protein
MFTILVIGCAVGLLLLIGAGVAVGLVLLLQGGGRDSVSSAREGWLHRRSEKDQEGW